MVAFLWRNYIITVRDHVHIEARYRKPGEKTFPTTQKTKRISCMSLIRRKTPSNTHEQKKKKLNQVTMLPPSRTFIPMTLPHLVDWNNEISIYKKKSVIETDYALRKQNGNVKFILPTKRRNFGKYFDCRFVCEAREVRIAILKRLLVFISVSQFAFRV